MRLLCSEGKIFDRTKMKPPNLYKKHILYFLSKFGKNTTIALKEIKTFLDECNHIVEVFFYVLR